jgi:hypothetical protein
MDGAMYTEKDLKDKYKKFAAAKEHFGVKANGWLALCNKLNVEAAKGRILDLEHQNERLQSQLEAAMVRILELEQESTKSDLDLMLTDLVYKRGVGSDEIFESSEAMEEEPEGVGRDDWAYFESVLKRRYFRLAKRYHPDRGGSNDQLNNLKHAYEVAKTFVKINGGLQK